MDKLTLDYYNRNAKAYFEQTKGTFVPQCMAEFLHRMPAGGRILDLGCGSGRDSLHFQKLGFEVVSVDGSEEMCRLASAYIGKPVVHADFLSYEPEGNFDGIWAMASLLHLKKEDLKAMLPRIAGWLAPEGTFALSLRYGDFVGERDGRFYTYETEESFSLLNEGSGLKLVSSWRSEDVRPGFHNTWINMIMERERTL